MLFSICVRHMSKLYNGMRLAKVVLEETTSQGTQDTAPMTIYHMIHSFEKRGILDLKVTGHSIERPPAVRRGEEADRLEVQHEAHSVFKPNAVTAKQCKATNVAGLLGYKSLQASQHLQLVWRTSVLVLTHFPFDTLLISLVVVGSYTFLFCMFHFNPFRSEAFCTWESGGPRETSMVFAWQWVHCWCWKCLPGLLGPYFGQDVHHVWYALKLLHF